MDIQMRRPSSDDPINYDSYRVDYESALAEGKMDVAYSRLMLLGTAGVGKTSFKRSLMQEPWDPSFINSTIISDIQSIRPVGREWQRLGHEENQQWSAVTDEDELEEMAELLAAVHQDDFSRVRSKISATELFQAPSDVEIVSEVSKENVEKIRKTHVQSVLSRAIDRASVLSMKGSHIKPQPFVHVWDCGGQPVFLEILPAFLTSRTMFFLLYDASKSFHEKWKSVQTLHGERKNEEEVHMSTLDLLQNWMSNIHIHLTKKDDAGALLNYPRILCIGTHADKLRSTFKRSERKEAVLREMKSHCSGKPFEALIDGFFIIDNTTAGKGKNEDPSFTTIRNMIRNFTFDKLMVETPISWVLFRKVIQMLETNVITVNEAQAIGVACKISPEMVPKVLLFYHDLGVVLFYPHIRGLQNTVIISPQWFVNALGKVLTLQGREEYRTRLMWDLLRNKGILVQPLYVAAWREIKDISPDALINLLVHFRLAAEVKTDQYYDTDARQYFLPLVLPSYVGQDSSPPSGYLQRATPLHLTFRTGFVPPGFFTRLITSMAASPQCEIQFNEGIYRNQVSILFGHPPCDVAILIELPYAIEVNFLRYAPESTALDKFTYICQELSDFLLQTAGEVNQCLFGNGSAKENRKIFKEVRFLCAAVECNATFGPHYLQHKTGQTCDLHLQCEKNREYRLVLKEEGLWFPTTSNTKKVTVQLSEREMYVISEKISPDFLPRLAALFNMTSALHKIKSDQSQSTSVGFSLLYEWRQSKAGVRHELVEALRELNLLQIALMVEQAEYDPEKLKKEDQNEESVPTREPTDLPSTAQTSQTEISYASQQEVPSTVIEFSQLDATIVDNDLLRCSRYFHQGDVNKLVGFLDDFNLNLQAVAQQYEDPHVKAYRVLKKWFEAHPDTTRQTLQEKLELMGFSKAARNLLPHQEQETCFLF